VGELNLACPTKMIDFDAEVARVREQLGKIGAVVHMNLQNNVRPAFAGFPAAPRRCRQSKT
jgi:hypothetical protein